MFDSEVFFPIWTRRFMRASWSTSLLFIQPLHKEKIVYIHLLHSSIQWARKDQSLGVSFFNNSGFRYFSTLCLLNVLLFNIPQLAWAQFALCSFRTSLKSLLIWVDCYQYVLRAVNIILLCNKWTCCCQVLLWSRLVYFVWISPNSSINIY